MKRYAFVCLILLSGQAFANRPEDRSGNGISSLPIAIKKSQHYLFFDFRPAYTLPTNKYFQGKNGTLPPKATLGVNLKYGFRFAPDSYFGRNYPHAIQGIGLGYHTFFNPKEMGNPLAVYAFQTARIASLTQNLSFDYEWNFGLSLGWRKYDPADNPLNTAVGSFVNAYINLGFMLNWQLSPATHLTAGIGMTHFSNGNTRYPNAGINTAGGYLSVRHRLGEADAESQSPHLAIPAPETGTFRQRMSYDVVVYGAVRKKGIFPDGETPVIAPGVFAVAGFNFNPLYRFNRYFRGGFSLDAQYDESANVVNHMANPDAATQGEQIQFYKPPFREQFGLGLSARAELVMPIFSINLGIGKNIVCRGADTRSSYQIIALKTDLTRHLFLHVGYQLYRFKDPNNLMLGVGYRFLR